VFAISLRSTGTTAAGTTRSCGVALVVGLGRGAGGPAPGYDCENYNHEGGERNIFLSHEYLQEFFFEMDLGPSREGKPASKVNWLGKGARNLSYWRRAKPDTANEEILWYGRLLRVAEKSKEADHRSDNGRFLRRFAFRDRPVGGLFPEGRTSKARGGNGCPKAGQMTDDGAKRRRRNSKKRIEKKRDGKQQAEPAARLRWTERESGVKSFPHSVYFDHSRNAGLGQVAVLLGIRYRIVTNSTRSVRNGKLRLPVARKHAAKSNPSLIICAFHTILSAHNAARNGPDG